MARRQRPVGRLREELGQLSWAARTGGGLRGLALQHHVNAALSPLNLPRRGVVPGSAWGVSVVRDEADIIGQVVRHQLDQGLDGVIVADNGSTDDTWGILSALAEAEPRLHLCRDAWPRHDQAEKVTRLARLAGRAGADWILPFDADEFWFAQGATLAEFLSRTRAERPDLTVLFANWHTMLPLGDDLDACDWIIDASPLPPGKVVVRSHPWLRISQGSHDAVRVGGRLKSTLRVAHAMYRSPAQVARKLRQGAQAEGASRHGVAAHWAVGSTLRDDEIAAAWARITAGGADARLSITAEGPMVVARPPSWTTWDPDGRLR
jgi:hypothetical protein